MIEGAIAKLSFVTDECRIAGVGEFARVLFYQLPKFLFRRCSVGRSSRPGQCIIKERPASEGRGCDVRRLRSAALCRGFAPLRRRLGE